MKLFDLFNIRALFFGPALLLLASCSSYQYAGYDQDGIYSSENREAITANDNEESYEDANYYKRLFADQSAQIDNLPQEGAIFTNVDSYTSTGAYGDEMYLQEGGLNYQGGNAPWGDQPDEIAINFYGSPFYSPFMGPYMGGFYGRGFYGGGFYGGFHDPFWGPSWYGPGWNSWRFGYGYHNPWRWNMGWGWNAGWGYNPYGIGYGHPYNYGNPYYGHSRRDVAYNNSRRSTYSDYDNNRSNVNGRVSRIQQYSNARNVRANRTSSDLVRRYRSDDDGRTYSTRTSRVESPSSRSRASSTYRSSNSRAYERSTNVRTTRNPRSTSTQVRSSNTSSQSRGTVRSSSPSRSSGTRSSGGSRGSRGGRGN